MAEQYNIAPPVVDQMTLPQIRALSGAAEKGKPKKANSIPFAQVNKLWRQWQENPPQR